MTTTTQSAWDVTTTTSWNDSDAVTMSTSADDGGAGQTGRIFAGFRGPNNSVRDNSTFVIGSVGLTIESGWDRSDPFRLGSVGSFANGFVLLALLCARQSRRKKINVFIINQTLLDLLACVFLIITIVFVRIPTTSVVAKWIVCLLFETNTLVAVVSYCSIFGLACFWFRFHRRLHFHVHVGYLAQSNRTFQRARSISRRIVSYRP